MPLAGRTCLLVFLCMIAGCWDSPPRQEAGDQPAAKRSGGEASKDRPLQKTAESSSANKVAAAGSPDEELGFKHTWKPKPAPPARTSAAAPAVAAHPADEENRYADLSPEPAVGKQADALRHIPGQSVGRIGSIKGVGQVAACGAGAPPRSRTGQYPAHGN